MLHLILNVHSILNVAFNTKKINTPSYLYYPKKIFTLHEKQIITKFPSRCSALSSATDTENYRELPPPLAPPLPSLTPLIDSHARCCHHALPCQSFRRINARKCRYGDLHILEIISHSSPSAVRELPASRFYRRDPATRAQIYRFSHGLSIIICTRS